MEESKPKWFTNVMAGLGVLLLGLNLWKPEIFSPEANAIVLTSINAIYIAVMTVIAAFAATDKLEMKNFK